ncbi:MAG TPA: hypothetical protein VIP77_24130 [Jiangellaceae bacterium]
MATEMADIDAYARGIQRTHVPVRPTNGGPLCAKCSQPWPCRDSTWQEQWLTSLTRTEAERQR